MSPAKRGHARHAHRWSKRQRPATVRRERDRLVVRWIGAAKRRGSRAVAPASIEVPSAQIIQLSWVDTFGRLGSSLPTCRSSYNAAVSIEMAGRI